MRSLQCARAFAALLVVYFHSVIQVANMSGRSGHTLIILGKCGVDVFFVLSGYIIWTSAQRSPIGARAFLGKRLLRICPLYWLLTIFAAVIAIAAPGVLKSTRYETTHFLASLAFVPWPNPASLGSMADLMSPVIVPGWTLNFEMMFYLLFSVTMIGGTRARLASVISVFGVAISIIWLFHNYSLTIGFYDPLLIIEFLIGIGLDVVLKQGFQLPLVVGVPFLVVAVFVLMSLDFLSLPVHRLFVSGIPAAGILYSLVSIELSQRWPRLPWLVKLGDASFSIYLTHIFVLAGMRMICQRIGVFPSGPLLSVLFVATALGISSVVGVATYNWVERPLGKHLRSLFGNARVMIR